VKLARVFPAGSPARGGVARVGVLISAPSSPEESALLQLVRAMPIALHLRESYVSIRACTLKSVIIYLSLPLH
jgi:hypothetical protein